MAELPHNRLYAARVRAVPCKPSIYIPEELGESAVARNGTIRRFGGTMTLATSCSLGRAASADRHCALEIQGISSANRLQSFVGRLRSPLLVTPRSATRNRGGFDALHAGERDR